MPRKGMPEEYGDWIDWLLCLWIAILFVARLPVRNPEGHSPRWWKQHPEALIKTASHIDGSQAESRKEFRYGWDIFFFLLSILLPVGYNELSIGLDLSPTVHVEVGWALIAPSIIVLCHLLWRWLTYVGWSPLIRIASVVVIVTVFLVPAIYSIVIVRRPSYVFIIPTKEVRDGNRAFLVVQRGARSLYNISVGFWDLSKGRGHSEQYMEIDPEQNELSPRFFWWPVDGTDADYKATITAKGLTVNEQLHITGDSGVAVEATIAGGGSELVNCKDEVIPDNGPWGENSKPCREFVVSDEVASMLSPPPVSLATVITQQQPPLGKVVTNPPFLVEILNSGLKGAGMIYTNGFWTGYMSLHGYTISPTNLALFLQVINTQPKDAVIDRFKVEMKNGNDWVVLTNISTLGRDVYNAYADTRSNPNDFSYLANAIRMDFSDYGFDNVLAKNDGVAKPNLPIRGWALFDYPKSLLNIKGDELIRITVTDAAGKSATHLHDPAEEKANANRVMPQLLKSIDKVDISNAYREFPQLN
jgi:hypothetical protein